MTLHICIFTTAHPWDDVRVKSKFVDSFLSAGHKVTWVGPDRSFFENVADRDSRVSYRVIATPGGWRGRLGLFGKLRRELRRVADVDWIYCPDPDAAALAVSARTGARVLFDIHEEYHKGHFVHTLPAALLGPAEMAVRTTIAAITDRVDLVTSVNQAILDCYRAAPSRSLVTFNTPPEWFARPAGDSSPTSSAALTLFHGKALAGNGTNVILQALAILQQRGVDVRVIMLPSASAGGEPYDHHFAEVVTRLGVAGSLDLRKAVPHKEMPALMSQAQVGLIAYNRTLGVGSLPNRFFEYMALGMPVIVPQYSPLMRQIAEREGIGWTADFENPESVATVIQQASETMGQLSLAGERARMSFAQDYAWEPIYRQLDDRLYNR